MTSHAFEIGDHVLIVPDSVGDERSGGAYEVVGFVPTDGKIPRYRVKSLQEPFSRVAPETALIAVFGPARPAPVIGGPVKIRAHNEPPDVTLVVTSATRMSLGVH